MRSSTVVLPLPEIFYGHGKHGHLLELLHYFNLDPNGLGYRHAASKWHCKDCCGLCSVIWFWWGIRTLRNGVPLNWNCVFLLEDSRHSLQRSYKGDTILYYYEFCSVLWYYSTHFYQKWWNSADSVQLKRGLLFFCLNLSSDFLLESWNIYFCLFSFTA